MLLVTVGGLMNKLSVVLIGTAIALAHGAQAAELRVLPGGAMTAVWAEVKPKFEQASGSPTKSCSRSTFRTRNSAISSWS